MESSPREEWNSLQQVVAEDLQGTKCFGKYKYE